MSTRTQTGPRLVKDGKPKGGVIKQINDKLEEMKTPQAAEKFEEIPAEELAQQEGRPAVLVQGELPGQETPQLEDVIRAAEDYRQKRDARMNATKLETNAQALLLGIMKKHSLREYHY